MSVFGLVNKSSVLLVATLSLAFATSALGQQSSGAPLPNCVSDSGTPMTPAVQDAASSTAPVIAEALGVDDHQDILGSVTPAFILGGAGGYGATAAAKGDHSFLIVAGKTSAGSTKGYFGPAAMYFYAPKDKLALGIGQNGVAAASSPDDGNVHATGDLILNGVYTLHQSKNGKYAVAAMVNANVNLGHKAYDNDLTDHSGVSPAFLFTLTPKDKNSLTFGIARTISLGGESGSGKTDTNVELDHQFSKSYLKNFVGSLGFQTAESAITPFTAVQYSKGSNQFSVGYSQDVHVAPGDDKTKGFTIGFSHSFKNKYAED